MYRYPAKLLRLSLLFLTVVILLTLTPLGVAALQWGLTVMLPTDTGAKAEAIVVLGRGHALQSSRNQTVLQLWTKHRAPQIFVSGMSDAPEMVQTLSDQGVPTAALWGERCSRTTAENAWYTVNTLGTKGIHKILLVTDPSHLWRSLLLFQLAGFDVIPHASPLPASWTPIRQLFVATREYAALAVFGFRRHFRGSSLNVHLVQELPSSPSFSKCIVPKERRETYDE